MQIDVSSLGNHGYDSPPRRVASGLTQDVINVIAITVYSLVKSTTSLSVGGNFRFFPFIGRVDEFSDWPVFARG